MEKIEAGSRVLIFTKGRINWAHGKKGTVVRRDGCLLDNLEPIWVVKVDGMDPNKPPYGLIHCKDTELDILEEPKGDDPVNHPSHYADGKYECIDYMEGHGYILNGYLFNAVKYLSRAGKKDPDKKDEDIQKALWYLKRMLEVREKTDFPDISTKDYLADKGLTGTIQGLALQLIEKQEYKLAIEALESHDKH